MTKLEIVASAVEQANPESETSAGPAVELGVYEKALPPVTDDWDAFFASSQRAGYSFVDLSIDETAARLSRLVWSDAQRQQVREAAERHGTRIGGLCLSTHRRIGLGSDSEQTRRQASALLTAGIDLCADLGIPVLQIAGYFAFYENPTPEHRTHYLRGLSAGTDYAARRGVLLGIENVDGPDLNSISSALEVVRAIGSPWLQLYPDVGNLSEQGLDAIDELRNGQHRMLAIHLKDTRRGEPRRVPMGEGEVPWAAVFAELARQNWSGRMMVEMWNDDAAQAERVAKEAGIFIKQKLSDAGIPVLSGHRSRSGRGDKS